jgi:hypothetical protein
MHLKFQFKNFIIFGFLSAIEICIALFVHDQFIRPFIGDVLVIWLIVYFLRSFLVIKKQIWLIGGVFLFACLIEIFQLFHVLEILNLHESRLFVIVFGATFDWLDILAYAVGSGLLLLAFMQTSKGAKHD